MPVIVHLGADQMLYDLSDIAGCITHYARLSDAAARHKYVKSVVSWCCPARDHLGHCFEQVSRYTMRQFEKQAGCLL